MASTGAEALEQAAKLQPDVTLMDIELGGGERLEARQTALSTGGGGALEPDPISADTEQDYADLIAASPAAGFLCTSALSAAAIRALLGSRDGDPLDPLSVP